MVFIDVIKEAYTSPIVDVAMILLFLSLILIFLLSAKERPLVTKKGTWNFSKKLLFPTVGENKSMIDFFMDHGISRIRKKWNRYEIVPPQGWYILESKKSNNFSVFDETGFLRFRVENGILTDDEGVS